MLKKEQIEKELGMSLELYCVKNNMTVKQFMNRYYHVRTVDKVVNFKRKPRTDLIKHYITYDNENIPLIEACRKAGINSNAVHNLQRKHEELSLEQAFYKVLDHKIEVQRKYQAYLDSKKDK